MDLPKIWSRLRIPYREDACFAAVFFAVVFVPLVFVNNLNDQVEVPKLALWTVCIAVAVIAFVRRPQPHTGLTVRYHKWTAILLAVFFLLSVISTFTSLDVVNSVFGLYGRFTSSILFYGLWGLTLLLMISIMTRDKFIFLCKTLVLTSAFIAIFGIIQNAGVAFYEGVNQSVRPLVPSFLGNPNFSGMFIASVLPLAVLFFAKAARTPARIYYGSAILLIIIGLALFASRGSLAAALGALALMAAIGLVMRLGKLFVAASAITFVLMVVVAGLFLTVTRPEVVGETVNLSETTVQLRFEAWDVSLKMIGRYPLLGTGPGNYFIGFNQFSNPVFANLERFDDAHNLFLHIAASVGLPAAAIFLMLLVVPLVSGWRTLRRTRDPLYLAVLVATLGWVVSSSFNPVVTGCWLLLALFMSGLMLESTAERVVALPRPGRIAIVAASVVAIVAALCFVASDAFAYDALVSYGTHNYRRSENSARAAVYLNPTNPAVAAFWAASRIRQNKPPEQTAKVTHYLVSLHPDSYRIQNASAVLYYLLYRQTNDSRYLREVAPHLENAYRIEHYQSSLDGFLAYTYYKIGDLDKALFYSRQALIINSKQIYSWVLVAEIEKEKGNRDGLLNALEQAKKADPSLQLLQRVSEEARKQPDISKISLPVVFPEPEVQI